MENNIKYKSFIKMSKYVTNFEKMSLFRKVIFYLEAPIRYKAFKKVYKEEMESKIVKKEVK